MVRNLAMPDLPLHSPPEIKLKSLLGLANATDEKLERLGYRHGDISRLRRWLKILARLADEDLPPPRLISEMDQALEGFTVTASARMDGARRRLILPFHSEPPTVISQIAYMLGVVMLEELRKSIRLCRLEGCNILFRAKPRQTYCCTAHNNADRQRRYRNKS